VHVNDDYGRGLVRMLRPQLENIAFEGMYADGGDSVMVTRLRDGIAASQPDLLVWLGRPRMLGLLLPQLRRILPDLAVLCADACDTAIVYDNAGGEYTGLFFVRFLEPGATDSATVSFRSRYQKQTGQVASGEALLTYDAVQLVRAALLDGARTREEVRQYLVSLGSGRPAFEGITGKLEFDGSGASTRRPYRLAQVREDGVAPAEHAMGRYEH
jgi:branched-chain amino acid transport system substrate-binding protein